MGWTGEPATGPEPFDAEGMQLVRWACRTDEMSDYYEGFSNATLWPLYHDVIAAARSSTAAGGRPTSRSTAGSPRPAAGRPALGAIVWVHDYQLQLVPAMLRDLRPDLRIGFFNHIPFPGYEIYSQLPWRRQVVEGLLGADLIGFQRQDDAANFLQACRRS